MKRVLGIAAFFSLTIISLPSFCRDIPVRKPDEQQIIAAAKGVIQRVMNDKKVDVRLSVKATANGLDSFSVQVKEGRLSISGRSGISRITVYPDPVQKAVELINQN